MNCPGWRQRLERCAALRPIDGESLVPAFDPEPQDAEAFWAPLAGQTSPVASLFECYLWCNAMRSPGVHNSLRWDDAGRTAGV